jgi:dihydroneopterin aldolase
MPTIDLEVVLETEIGIAPWERGRLQSLTVKVSANVKLDAALRSATSGDIAQTIDYALFRNIIHQVFEGKRFNLLEQPAFLIKHEISKLECVEKVHVSVEKPFPWPDVPRVKLTI